MRLRLASCRLWDAALGAGGAGCSCAGSQESGWARRVRRVPQAGNGNLEGNDTLQDLQPSAAQETGQKNLQGHANQLGAPLRQDGIAPSAAESDNLQEPAAEEKPALILLKLEVSPSLGAAKMMRKQLRASHPEVLGARSIFFHKAEGVEGAPGYSVLAGPFLDQAMAITETTPTPIQNQ